MKLVIAKDKLVMGGVELCYRLDVSRSPHQIDWGLTEDDLSFSGILQLDGDALRLCIHRAGGGRRPERFATAAEDGNALYLFERLPSLAQSPEIPLEPDLRAFLDKSIDLLEQDRVSDFLKLTIPESRQAQMKGPSWKEAVEQVRSQRVPLANTLRALRKTKPDMNAEQTLAVFDLSQVEIENGAPFQEVKIRRIDKQWRLVED